MVEEVGISALACLVVCIERTAANVPLSSAPVFRVHRALKHTGYPHLGSERCTLSSRRNCARLGQSGSRKLRKSVPAVLKTASDIVAEVRDREPLAVLNDE